MSNRDCDNRGGQTNEQGLIGNLFYYKQDLRRKFTYSGFHS